jgi:methyl-accepting chemotaxis protein
MNALDEILANVSTVNEMVIEISTASKEQSIGVQEINKAMSEMDRVTQSNSYIAQESSKASQDLQSQAVRLNNLVKELTSILGSKNDSRENVIDKEAS